MLIEVVHAVHPLPRQGEAGWHLKKESWRSLRLSPEKIPIALPDAGGLVFSTIACCLFMFIELGVFHPMFRVTPMLSFYVGEDKLGNHIWPTPVRYLSEGDRDAYRLEVQNGRIYDVHGNLFDTTSSSTVFSQQGLAIFVMDAEGTIYASMYQRVGDFHHSSLVAGEAVAAAGEIGAKNGILVAITDKSGHYTPRKAFTEQFVTRLRGLGVDMRKVRLEVIATS